MKKISILSFLLIGMFAACKKSSSGPTYHVSGSVDGSGKSFNYLCKALKVSQGSSNMISIMGAADATMGTSVVTIVLFNNAGSITTGTYIDSVSSATTVDVDYTFPAQNLDYFGGTSAYLAASKTIANHTKVVISYIDSTSIRGTFSGDLFLQGDATAAKKTITNGDFNVKFQ
jgi:hypothetical protein